MTMVELKPGFSIREDMVGRIKLCPVCNGNHEKWQWAGWQNPLFMIGRHVGKCSYCYSGFIYTPEYFEDKLWKDNLK